MKRHWLAGRTLLFCLALSPAALAQHEGALPTQMLVGIDAKATAPPVSALTVNVDNHKQPLSSWTPVVPAQAQVALLIDDGLRESVGRELSNLRAFVKSLPQGTEVLVGYMENGRVVANESFSTDHETAASELRLPEGVPGVSASPYFCLSDFVKKWPGARAAADPNATPTIGGAPAQAGGQKARFVLMITNGVDPYNGSTSVLNQDSPYVASAITDAQQAGVAVYSIYFGDAGIRGGSASFSGQSYLQQLAQGTGAVNYYEGNGNPVSTAPYLAEFERAIAGTYIATFEAPVGKKPEDLVHIKLTSSVKTKLRAPDEVRPGNME